MIPRAKTQMSLVDVPIARQRRLGHLGGFGRGALKLRAKHLVPESAGHAKAVVVVGKVVLQVILLELAVVVWETVWRTKLSAEFPCIFETVRCRFAVDLLAMMQEVMCHIVADVSEDSTAVHHDSRVPVVEENGMRELVEGTRQHDEQGRRHHEAVPVHRQVVVDTVEKEVERNSNPVIGKISNRVR